MGSSGLSSRDPGVQGFRVWGARVCGCRVDGSALPEGPRDLASRL